MHQCVRDIDFAPLYDFAIWFWNFFDSVGFFPIVLYFYYWSGGLVISVIVRLTYAIIFTLKYSKVLVND